ncbi:MAG: hypothetical protein ACR2FZ_01865 [Thermoleophilaceae bacterium]
MIAHGVIRGTKVLDICPDPAPATLERLAALLIDLDARQVGVGDFDQREMPFDPRSPGDLAEGGNFLVETRLGRLDVMQWVPGIEADSAYPVLVVEAVEGLVHGAPVKALLAEPPAAYEARRGPWPGHPGSGGLRSRIPKAGADPGRPPRGLLPEH